MGFRGKRMPLFRVQYLLQTWKQKASKVMRAEFLNSLLFSHEDRIDFDSYTTI